jgi:hypothetical protein
MTRVVMFPMVFVFAFLFVVLMVLLLGKARKARVGVLIGVILFVVGFFVVVPVVTHRRVVHEPLVDEYPTATVKIQSDQGTALMAVSPIWSEGVENEFEADIYPSRLAAASWQRRSLSGRARSRALRGVRKNHGRSPCGRSLQH